MHVRVSHPAPLRIVPRGGRHERVVLAPCETAAEIPEAEGHEFASLGVSVGATELTLRNHEIWGAAPINPVHAGGRHATPAEAFAAWLSGDPVTPVLDRILCDVMRGTPLVAKDPGTAAATGPDARFVRAAPPPGGIREIRRDLREPAAEGVRSLLKDGFRIVGGRVMMRLHPMATFEPIRQPGPDGTRPPAMAGLVLHPRSLQGGPFPFAPGRIALAAGRQRLAKWRANAPLEGLLRAMAANPIRLDDRAILLQTCVVAVHEALCVARKRFPNCDLDPDLVPRLEPIADHALAGIAHLADPGDGIELLARAADTARPYVPASLASLGWLSNLVGHIGQVLTPPATMPEDEAALAALALP
jgi:hypothetical protein